MAQPRPLSPPTRSDAARGSASPSLTGATSRAVIAAGTRVHGRLTGEGDLTVEGDLEGEVTLRGEIFIAEGGRVVSDVDASGLRIAGTLEGDVTVTGDVTILAGARVRGDLHGASVSLEEGAELDGRLDSEFSMPRELESMGAARR